MPRPPIPADQRKSHPLVVPMTEASRKLIRQAAEACYTNDAAWARAKLLKAAESELSEA